MMYEINIRVVHFEALRMLPSVDPPPPEDPSRCQLLGPTALAVQAASRSSLLLTQCNFADLLSGSLRDRLLSRQAAF